jgi:hypothetical protein
MHVQVINFELEGIEEGAYRAMCDELAPAFAAIPGLLSKVWLADADTGTFGGVYLWVDEAAYVAFTQSDLFHAVATNPNLRNISSRAFGVLDAPTAVTAGHLSVAV